MHLLDLLHANVRKRRCCTNNLESLIIKYFFLLYLHVSILSLSPAKFNKVFFQGFIS